MVVAPPVPENMEVAGAAVPRSVPVPAAPGRGAAYPPDLVAGPSPVGQKVAPPRRGPWALVVPQAVGTETDPVPALLRWVTGTGATA